VKLPRHLTDPRRGPRALDAFLCELAAWALLGAALFLIVAGVHYHQKHGRQPRLRDLPEVVRWR